MKSTSTTSAPKLRDTRVLAAYVIMAVTQEGHSLNEALPAARDKAPANERGLLAELCYGSLRHFYELDALTQLLMQTPLHEKDAEVQALLLVGLYQLRYMRLAEHAAVNQTVNASKVLNKPWAVKLVNGVLRNYLRRAAELNLALEKNPLAHYNHPQWLINIIEQAWPAQAPSVFAANNQQGGMSLRVNVRQNSVADYQTQLAMADINSTPSPIAPQALQLAEPKAVDALPGFFDGHCSVQDIAAQLCAPLLQLAPGLRVLDACCAPGGKTGHILETEPALAELVSVDNEAPRLIRLRENLARLHLQATVICADVAEPKSWHKGSLYDRILLDAPCSGTGVISRHPDIKHLRRESDITPLAERQQQMLDVLWPLLKTGGTLLYTTCSVLPQENEAVIAAFLRQHPDAHALTIKENWGITQPHGRQLLPTANNDGFYFARLCKSG